MVERKSGYAKLYKVTNKSAESVTQAIIKCLTPLQARLHTLTFDNGGEFAGHAHIDASLGCISYFAKPYCSWQRGSNENYNGLVRQYIPKNRPLNTVSEAELKMIETQLNLRPKKKLGYQTPDQVLTGSLARVALRT